MNKKILIDKDYFEHLLNCLANQKYIGEMNADATECDYKSIQKENQQIIDTAWREGMEIVGNTKSYTPEELKTKIGEAVGYASLCWEPKPLGVFDSTNALTALNELYNFIN